MTQQSRMCPWTKQVCTEKLPDKVTSVTLYGSIPICGVACAEGYAASIGQGVIGQHMTFNGKNDRVLEYTIGVSQQNPEKSNH